MNNIQSLDCTLRDGGYINKWNFRSPHITSIIKYLNEAKIDIIECGYLNQNAPNNVDSTIFNSIEAAVNYLPTESNAKYVLMINLGEYDVEKIEHRQSNDIFGFRIVFKKEQWVEAIKYAEALIEKDYAVFIQPMMTINYSDEELLSLIHEINRIEPYACYIVDSFGVMKQNDLLRLSYIFDHNLKSDIILGYHAHNNLQLAFSNAQVFVEIMTKRKKIIDSSVYGMGRGAGNLNTELFVQYLNDNYDGDYCIEPLLKIIDESLSNIYQETYWGYSMPHYLSAVYYCHPNYASYLVEKNTLRIDDLKNVISNIEESKKGIFNKVYIEELYQQYQNNSYNDEVSIKELKESVSGQEVLLLGPGKSIVDQKLKIDKFIELHKPIIISVNFESKVYEENLIFISNTKRYQLFNGDLNNNNVILTSNIENNGDYKVNYKSLLTDNLAVSDNSLLMILNLLKKLDIKRVNLAGFDGYTVDSTNNYANIDLIFTQNKNRLLNLNQEISSELIKLSSEMKIRFITSSLYEFNGVLSYSN
ncbi:aldolase catalytic domain-containing protein [Lysinibacillus sp. BPa_S21]|uniref:aldolase catalytic domain-containing protein n=1 Tax=Lysinibacillus sp. BPa_S21 TaxID=2932478 RepID=UPI002011226B|nr:aldolase catalytic domain-containing protein [Lysinibacillus sp. BPa_S21]MCL1695816.1 aldolase catalytic domain-containing protein [Lysinibacillus sp. BPa_S21]